MATPGYRPYTSDSETDSGSESDSTVSTDSTSSGYASIVTPTNPLNFRLLAENLSLTKTAGGPMDSSGQVMTLGDTGVQAYPIKYGYDTFANFDLPKDPSGAELKSSPQSITSIVMLDSRDRDRNAFPQPTQVTLRLPRVYSNVTSFQLVQVKLLSSFFYFRPNKNNTDVSIIELDRTAINSKGVTVPNIIKTLIRQGTYDVNSLLSELSTQLNITPIFYDFPNGFQDFAPRFAATGDFSIGFNFPGDNFYDSLLDEFTPNPTTTFIISKYFQNRYAGLSSYTTDQIKIAYYYPVLKEVLLDTTYSTPINLILKTSAPYLLPSETVYSRCIYTFQGINDPVVLEVININTVVLDDYRLHNTFRYYLINK